MVWSAPTPRVPSQRGAGADPQGDPRPGDKIELKKSNWIDSFVGRTLQCRERGQLGGEEGRGGIRRLLPAPPSPPAVVKAVKNLLLQKEHPSSCCRTPLPGDATPNAGAQAMEQVDVIDGQGPDQREQWPREELKLDAAGLWKNNPLWVQVLGLCPTLAVSSTFTNALGLGLATMVVLISSNLAISLVRNWVPRTSRIPVYVMIIAAPVTSVQLLMNATPTRPVSGARHLHRPHRHQLRHRRPGRGLCLQEPFACGRRRLHDGLGFPLVLLVLGPSRDHRHGHPV